MQPVERSHPNLPRATPQRAHSAAQGHGGPQASRPAGSGRRLAASPAPPPGRGAHQRRPLGLHLTHLGGVHTACPAFARSSRPRPSVERVGRSSRGAGSRGEGQAGKGLRRPRPPPRSWCGGGSCRGAGAGAAGGSATTGMQACWCCPRQAAGCGCQRMTRRHASSAQRMPASPWRCSAAAHRSRPSLRSLLPLLPLPLLLSLSRSFSFLCRLLPDLGQGVVRQSQRGRSAAERTPAPGSSPAGQQAQPSPARQQAQQAQQAQPTCARHPSRSPSCCACASSPSPSPCPCRDPSPCPS
jgi:hypothetical protein